MLVFLSNKSLKYLFKNKLDGFLSKGVVEGNVAEILKVSTNNNGVVLEAVGGENGNLALAIDKPELVEGVSESLSSGLQLTVGLSLVLSFGIWSPAANTVFSSSLETLLEAFHQSLEVRLN